jgi:hypothetical protein
VGICAPWNSFGAREQVASNVDGTTGERLVYVQLIHTAAVAACSVLQAHILYEHDNPCQHHGTHAYSKALIACFILL